MEVGYVQVYTGDGKGKTTAALGQGLRAVGRGLKVVMVQFLKGIESGELEAVKRLDPQFTIMRFAETRKFFWQLTDEEKEQLKEKTQQEMQQLEQLMKKGSCDVLILDEIMAAIHGGLVSVEQICRLIDDKPKGMELILTGRNVPREIADRADLITEMRNVKHYLNKGVPARKGIEY
ncbi:cob(I)yrinic acid a,c-diamide adenosyltransferase [Caldicoprobacter algeriensis]|uniref:cob(I)yrinic acid a,c-diamide adenosyltransferase n=1 Tax=Caldicoprobacter algeriensis TaxID=699281 RepID=UPI002079406D|nr:cob(I)yrinic acid a,c-diamide adenosyltransferase [Caldicoprobacter algeriensis]MCM8899984.1 cob(I)yrinic acid a,c-diamide adenosyltransferase [Caldicoprobacter algeriensis]